MTVLSAVERKQRNAFYFLEKMLQIDGTFKHKFDGIRRNLQMGQLTQKQANQQIWRELEHAVRKQN